MDSHNGFYNPPSESILRQFFNDIAQTYDFTNTIMSFGQHYYWQKVLLKHTGIVHGDRVLDVCCGTGSIIRTLLDKVGQTGTVSGIDFSPKMLENAKLRLEKNTQRNNYKLILGNAMDLPFPDNSFDCVTIGYGLRNVPNYQQVLREMKRVVRRGGKVIALEMSQPDSPPIKSVYLWYLKHWIPFIGKLLVKNEAAYQYLYHSIINFPPPHRITEVYQSLGFKNIQCQRLTLGVATIYSGQKT